MKQAIVFTLLLALFVGVFAGCSGTNYGYDYEMPYRGNVSTTDNGRVNGTNDRAWRDSADADTASERTREKRELRRDNTENGARGSNADRNKIGKRR